MTINHVRPQDDPSPPHADAMLETQSRNHDRYVKMLLGKPGSILRRVQCALLSSVPNRETAQANLCFDRTRNSSSPPLSQRLNHELGLGTGAARVSSIGVARELNRLVLLELESLLESLANLLECLLALLLCPALAAIAGDGTADGAGPQTNTVESSPDVDNDTHDLVVVLVLEVLANSSEHDVEPERVDVDGLLVLELERPLAAVLVLRVFPLRTNAPLEEVVIRLQRQVRCGCDVVL
jgi:hypothetical protein